ncbi:RGS domain-containing protein [Plasmodiophora brassicae]
MPIRHRLPYHMVLATALLSLYAQFVCIDVVFRDAFSTATSQIVAFLLLDGAIDGYVYRNDAMCCVAPLLTAAVPAGQVAAAGSLFVVFNRTNAQLVLADRGLALDTTLLNRVQFWVRVSSWLIGKTATAVFVLGNITILLAAQLTFVLGFHPELFEARDDANPAASTLLYIGTYKTMFSAAWIVVLSWKLRMVSDASGTKASLKRVGAVFALAYLSGAILSYAATSSIRLPAYVDTLFANLVFIEVVIQPLLQSEPVTERPTTAAADSRDDSPLFVQFLRMPEGFEAFKAHAIKEYSVENVCCWADVEAFRNEADPQAAQEKARAIVDKYLARNAPMEVNLSSALLKTYRDPALLSNVRSDMFDQVSASLVKLMEVDSFDRFRAQHLALWNAFTATVTEGNILNAIGAAPSATRNHTGPASMSSLGVTVDNPPVKVVIATAQP